MAHRKPEFVVGPELRIEAFGEPLPAFEGETVAAALLAAGRTVFSRSVKYHRPRGPFCLAGRCANCLVRVDGVPNRFACLTAVAPGMQVEAQNVVGSASLDALGAIDFLFPRGLDHHEMFAGVPVVEKAVAGVARHLAGLGKLPDAPAAAVAPADVRTVDLAVVGAGPAGLSLARAAAEAGLSVELVDENARPGGRLRCGMRRELEDWVEGCVAAIAKRGTVSLNTLALAAYRSAHGPFLALRTTAPAERISLLHAKYFALCPGGSETLPIFTNNDLPGIFAARGLLKLCATHGVVPGEQVVVLAEHAEGLQVAEALQAAGARVAAVVDPSGALSHATLPVIAGRIDRAAGRTHLTKVRVVGAGRPKTLSCDLLAISAPPAPSFELGRQLGLRAHFTANLGFTLAAAENGATSLPHVFLAGEVNGPLSVEACMAQGAAAARALVAQRPSEAIP